MRPVAGRFVHTNDDFVRDDCVGGGRVGDGARTFDRLALDVIY